MLYIRKNSFVQNLARADTRAKVTNSLNFRLILNWNLARIHERFVPSGRSATNLRVKHSTPGRRPYNWRTGACLLFDLVRVQPRPRNRSWQPNIYRQAVDHPWFSASSCGATALFRVLLRHKICPCTHFLFKFYGFNSNVFS